MCVVGTTHQKRKNRRKTATDITNAESNFDRNWSSKIRFCWQLTWSLDIFQVPWQPIVRHFNPMVLHTFVRMHLDTVSCHWIIYAFHLNKILPWILIGWNKKWVQKKTTCCNRKIFASVIHKWPNLPSSWTAVIVEQHSSSVHQCLTFGKYTLVKNTLVKNTDYIQCLLSQNKVKSPTSSSCSSQIWTHVSWSIWCCTASHHGCFTGICNRLPASWGWGWLHWPQNAEKKSVNKAPIIKSKKWGSAARPPPPHPTTSSF